MARLIPTATTGLLIATTQTRLWSPFQTKRNGMSGLRAQFRSSSRTTIDRPRSMRKCGELPLLKKITIRREQVEDWESYPFSIPIIRCLEELASDLGFVFSRERMARESLPC